MKHPDDMSGLSIIDVYYEEEEKTSMFEKSIVDPLAVVLMNFDSDGIENHEEYVCAVNGMGLYSYVPKKLDLDLKNRPTHLAKPSIEESPLLELKELSSHLKYVFLGNGNTLPIIIAADLGKQQVEALISVLQRYKIQ